MSKLYVQYPYNNPELWCEGTTEECEKVISDYEQRIPDYFSDADYVWIEEDDEFEDETINKDRSRETRRDAKEAAKARKAAIASARKAHDRKKFEDDYVIIIKNPRGSFVKIVSKKDNQKDPADRKRNRRAGKKVCYDYFVEWCKKEGGDK